MPTSPLTTRTSLAALPAPTTKQKVANLGQVPTKQRPNPNYNQPAFFATKAIMHQEFLFGLWNYFVLEYNFLYFMNTQYKLQKYEREFLSKLFKQLYIWLFFSLWFVKLIMCSFILERSPEAVFWGVWQLPSVHLLLLVNYYFFSKTVCYTQHTVGFYIYLLNCFLFVFFAVGLQHFSIL